MSLKLVTVMTIVLVFLLLGISLFADSSSSRVSEATGLAVSIDSFPTYLETHPIIDLLPNGAHAQVVIGDSIYEVKKGSVSLTKEVIDKDLSIYLPQGYESRIGEVGLCAALKEAVKNNEIRVETYTTKLNLLIKYHKLIKYSDCVEG